MNFTEAQYICNVIYEGDLLVINSIAEQKQVVQYLHDQLGFNTMPVSWLGGTLTPPNEIQWVDGSQAQYSNFLNSLKSNRVDTRKCIKIYSLFVRGSSGAGGQWSADSCSTRDSGYICQKIPDPNASRARVKDEMYSDEAAIAGKRDANNPQPPSNLLLNCYILSR
ncbi:hypothetical protein B4U79_17305 [Dinothrombium tinctorium]|uniref:C-type lectin domain-containing protein n=1 Tax=Dinothrombium tinctorium TaxID=1965070 RepID=A0A3S3Q5E2_9ACAR|nr:hypothetical protein B4U79_17305 [Dinothrombium tinctorium]